MLDERVRTPFAPHELEHSLHAPQARRQLMAQACVWHCSVSDSGPQLAPFNCAGRKMSRLRLRVPPPHDTEQEPQLPHCVATQSTGQASVLQISDWRVAAHSVPSYMGCCCTVRVRERWPLPHVALHPLHTPQSANLQSSAQFCTLQSAVSLVVGHVLPPSAGCCVIARDRVCVPTPQVVLHAPQGPKAATMQSAGHATSPQVCSSTSFGHTESL